MISTRPLSKDAHVRNGDKEPAVLFLGAAAPDGAPRNLATSPAANLFQRGLLRALRDRSSATAAFYSPIPSWPRGPVARLGGQASFDSVRAKSFGFVNLGVLKAITLTPAVVLQILRWAWQSQGRSRSVMTYNLGSPPGIAAYLGAKLTRSKFVPMLCDVLVPGETAPNTRSRRAHFALERWLIRRADGRVVVNAHIADDFAPGLDYMLLPGGIERREAEAMKREPADRPSGPLHVLYAGGLDELHGMGLLLDTLEAYPDLDVRLTVCGRGPLHDAVRTAAESDPRVEFLGLVERQKALELTCQADVVVSLCLTRLRTARYLYPSKVTEILASGTPLLATPYGGIRDEVGHTCWILEEETKEGLAAALRTLIATPEPERRARSAEGRRLALETRTWEAYVDRLTEYLST